MSEYNVFLASPRGESTSTTEEAHQTVYQRFCKAVPNAKITVIRSADEFTKSFKGCGGWDQWTTHVATGLDYEFRTPLFNAIVCTTETVGKATAQIVEKALANRRMVAFVSDDKISQVVGVEVIDGDNWQTGWRLTITS
jgi:hypothetical protein